MRYRDASKFSKLDMVGHLYAILPRCGAGVQLTNLELETLSQGVRCALGCHEFHTVFGERVVFSLCYKGGLDDRHEKLVICECVHTMEI